MTLNDLINFARNNNVNFNTELVFRDDYEHYRYLINTSEYKKISIGQIGVDKETLEKYGSFEEAIKVKMDVIELSD